MFCIWGRRGRIGSKKSKVGILSDTDHSRQGTAIHTAPTAGEPGFPIIGIGASAGGLEAFELFFKAMPPDSGMAFVLIPHLDPGHASMLSEILQRITTMPVHEAEDPAVIEPDHVYIIPPNKDMSIFHGTLHLSVPEQARGQRTPIDSFFRSLAEDQGERAVCVILSGSGSDGTLGLRAVHGAGGVSFVQEPSTAKYDGMPSSAIQSGLANYVLPADKIPDQLTTYVKTIGNTHVRPPLPAPAEISAITRIMMLLRSKTGNDFSRYKKSTIMRRIERRMVVHNLSDIDIYARYLQENHAEVQVLFKELLINVTNFFRDPKAFEALEKKSFPDCSKVNLRIIPSGSGYPDVLPVKRRILLPYSSASTWTRSKGSINSRSMRPISMMTRLRRPGQALPIEYHHRCFSRPDQTFFCERRARVPHKKRDQGDGRLRNPERHHRSPVYENGPDQLPEPADLPGA